MSPISLIELEHIRLMQARKHRMRVRLVEWFSIGVIALFGVIQVINFIASVWL
ncbi:hypothetical protein HQ945_08575 [Phyllobacterium sp. BT25]|uniref:Uncharacterized protein n=1 Tax=Phyllobacterium pellucidum TaxID=2740464 RepID=A0A849VRM5_9HYPH|nr:hypothetical protein [Phyllobacterium pellucidum]NTS31309.1 hypothetical protein [Phyllobacterium pellucidum]